MSLIRIAAVGEGVPDLRIAAYPGAIQVHSVAEMTDNYKKKGGVIDQIIVALTKPLKSSGEGSSCASALKSPEKKESIFSGTFEEVNSFFYEQGWTDGYPIVPPTIKKVGEFLKYIDFPPDKEVAKLPLANLRATPRNIAANGVMAGCRPEYMPILVAAAEAMGDPKASLDSMGTTGSIELALIVSGPITKQLKFYSGTGLLAPKTRANSTVGRAAGLILKNIAGFTQGKMDMGAHGLPGYMLIVDDLEQNPWEPFHVEMGFDKNASTISATCWGTCTPDFATVGSTATSHLDGFLEPMRRISALESWLFAPRTTINVLVAPPVAKIIATEGYSKSDMKQYIWENARITRRELEARLAPIIYFKDVAKKYPKLLDVGPDDLVPLFESPDRINIIVNGTVDRNRSMIMQGWYCQTATKEIKLPAKWDKLMEKAGYRPLKEFFLKK